MNMKLSKKIIIPDGSQMKREEYLDFLEQSYKLLLNRKQYFAPDEDINYLELAHLIPEIKETVIAIYVGINDAVCNKGLVSPFLVRHGHNNVFAFDPQVFPGGSSVPSGTLDAKQILSGFEPPNNTWHCDWTYVMIEDPSRTFESLWAESGYIDMIPAKFEDFTVLSDTTKSKLCVFIDPVAFEHPVNKNRPYLNEARSRGEKIAKELIIPEGLEGETKGLAPVVLKQGEKLYVARPDFGPCAHCWNNIHPDNSELAVVNENSAVPLDLVIAKPPVNKKYVARLIAPKGSADMSTDWFYRGQQITRSPLLKGVFKG